MIAKNSVTFITVYLHQTRDAQPLPHVYQTRHAIGAKGGRIVEGSAREVPNSEVSEYGLWRPQLTPVT